MEGKGKGKSEEKYIPDSINSIEWITILLQGAENFDGTVVHALLVRE